MAELTSFRVDDDGARPVDGDSKIYRKKTRMDFSDTNITTSDTAIVFEVKAKQLLLGMTVEVITVEGGTATIDIGLTGGDVDKFIDGADINVAAALYHSGIASTPEVMIAAGGHMFATADNIDLKPLNDLDTAIIDVCAWFVDLS